MNDPQFAIRNPGLRPNSPFDSRHPLQNDNSQQLNHSSLDTSQNNTIINMLNPSNDDQVVSEHQTTHLPTHAQTEASMMRTEENIASQLRFSTISQFEQHLIDDREKRLENISQQINNFVIIYGAYFMFFTTILVQWWLFPKLQVQISFFCLIGYHTFQVVHYTKKLRNPYLMAQFPWQKIYNKLKICENLLYIIVYMLIMIYTSNIDSQIQVNGFIILSPALVACGLNVFFIQIEETPCNSTMNLVSKSISILRILMAISIIMKIDQRTHWDWSTTFWPYWCSFAIQGIMAIGSLVIFMNNLMGYLKHQSNSDDVIASFFVCFICTGFVIATLLPIINIISLFDKNEQQQKQSNEVSGKDDISQKAFLILRAPIAYTLITIILTLVCKPQFINWFEHVLYLEDEETSTLIQRNQNTQQQQNANDNENQSQDVCEQEEQIIIKTYKFKTPQFIKRLTNTYFKKSQKDEKQAIIRRDMLKNLEDAKKQSNHKKNKSESVVAKNHNRNLSMIGTKDNNDLRRHVNKKIREEDFFDFQDSNREISAKETGLKREKQQRHMSYDFNSMEQMTGQRKRQQSRVSVSLNQRDCCICFDNRPDAVIMECGHGGICYECAKQLIAHEPRVCHLCREDIAYILKMDLSTMYSDFIKVISATFIDDEESESNEQQEGQATQQPLEINNPESSTATFSHTQVLSPRRVLQQHIPQNSHRRGTSLIDIDGQPTLFLQNPFIIKRETINRLHPPPIEKGDDVIEFVSPRPNEEEEKESDDMHDPYALRNGFHRFRDDVRSTREEYSNEYSDKSHGFKISHSRHQSKISNAELETYKKQLSNRKFTLFQINKPTAFQKFENVSSLGDSLEFSARSNPYEDNNAAISNTKFSFRDTINNRYIVNSKQNQRTGSIHLVEEFFDNTNNHQINHHRRRTNQAKSVSFAPNI